MSELAVTLQHDRLYPNPGLLVTFLGHHDVPRFMSEAGATPAAMKLAYSFLLTTRGIPLVYYGDEIGMSGGEDPDNRRDFPGGWRSDPHNAFVASGRTAEEQDLFSYLRRLLHLRAELEPLRRGKLINLIVSARTYVYARGTVLVVINDSPEPVAIKSRVEATGLKDGTVLVDRLGSGQRVPVLNGAVQLEAPARSALVLAAP